MLQTISRCIAKYIACKDLRTEAEEIAKECKISTKTYWAIISRLRSNPYKYWPQHIRDIRPLGLATIIVRGKKHLPEVKDVEDLKRTNVPLYRYMHYYRETFDGATIYSYFAPQNLIDYFMDVLERLGDVDYGYTIPVRPQCDNTGNRQDATLFVPSLPSRISRMLALLIYALLDLSPLARLSELSDIAPVLRERLSITNTHYRLHMGKVAKTYMRLSERRLLGRVLLLLLALKTERPIPMYIEVKRECSQHLYEVAAETWSAPSIFIGKNVAATVMVLPDELSQKVKDRLKECITHANIVTRGFGTTLPIEMYDPCKREWKLQEQPLLKNIAVFLKKKR
jgi:hypothetical protein